MLLYFFNQPERSLASYKVWSYSSAFTILPPKNLPFNASRAAQASKIKVKNKLYEEKINNKMLVMEYYNFLLNLANNELTLLKVYNNFLH